MQVRDNTKILKAIDLSFSKVKFGYDQITTAARNYSRIKYLTKTLISCGVVYLVVYKLIEIDDLGIIWQSLVSPSRLKNLEYLMFAALLIPVNWGLEAWKWNKIMSLKENVSFLNSYKSVLMGLGANVLFPWGLGDYYGRIYNIKNQKYRAYAVGGISLNGMVQMIPTLLFGVLPVLYLLRNQGSSFGWLLTVVAGSLVMILAILFIVPASNFQIQWKYTNKIKPIFESFTRLKASYFMNLLLISITRYIVFAIQFFFIILYFNIELPTHLVFFGIFWVFLTKTLVPKFSELTDLATRSLAAVFFFEQISIESQLIVAATLMIWVLNVVTPSLVGAYYIQTSK